MRPLFKKEPMILKRFTDRYIDISRSDISNNTYFDGLALDPG